MTSPDSSFFFAVKFLAFWERWVFKTRYIIQYRPAHDHAVAADVRTISMNSSAAIQLLASAQQPLQRHLKNRLGKTAWQFFYVMAGNDIAGYSFLHMPEQEEWLDSLPTFAGEARVCSNFVSPQYRNNGIRKKITQAQLAFSAKSGLRTWCVIERVNDISLRAELRFGKKLRSNYLIKAIGFNVASILTGPCQLYILTKRRRIAQ